MKKVLLIFTLMLLFSCQIQYDGGSKYIVQTKVVDKNGNALPEIPISVSVYLSGLSDEISIGETDKDGIVTLLFPPPEGDEAIISISYLPYNYNSEPSLYFPKEIDQLKKADFKDYIYNTGAVILLKKEDVIEFTVLRQQINQNNQITSFSTNAISTGGTINVNSDLSYYFPLSLLVLKNQTFSISYSITNYNDSPPSVTNYSQELTIGTEPSSYTIVY